MTPKQAAILYWRNDNPPQELIAAMAEAQRPMLEALGFYARERNWRAAGMYMCGHAPDSACARDGGQRAASAIAATNGE